MEAGHFSGMAVIQELETITFQNVAEEPENQSSGSRSFQFLSAGCHLSDCYIVLRPELGLLNGMELPVGQAPPEPFERSETKVF